MIKSSLDWYEAERDLLQKSKNIVHVRQMRKILDNIHGDVCELSIAEIDARRGKPKRAEALLQKINEDLKMLEEYILVTKLLG